MKLVADASAIVDYLLRATPATAAILRSEQVELHAPELIDLELVSAVRSLALGGALSEERLQAVVADYLDFPIRLHPHRPLLARVFELRHNFSSYDASYLALAESLGAALFTADPPLARAARRHTALRVLSPLG